LTNLTLGKSDKHSELVELASKKSYFLNETDVRTTLKPSS
jgi:hypothetical protein